MVPITRNLVLGLFVVLVSVFAFAVGRHHRPFSAQPASAHMAPRPARSIVIEQHGIVEKVPTAPVLL
jgi:hypothetical protein